LPLQTRMKTAREDTVLREAEASQAAPSQAEPGNEAPESASGGEREEPQQGRAPFSTGCQQLWHKNC